MKQHNNPETEACQIEVKQVTHRIFGHKLLAPQTNLVDDLLRQHSDLAQIHPTDQADLVICYLILRRSRAHDFVNFSHHGPISDQSHPAIALHEIIHNPENGEKIKP